MSLNADDIRAAVRAGMISERQAASLVGLADLRRGARENMDGLDEPFELFKGFNEIFIVVGLAILYSGWLAVTGLGLFEGGALLSIVVGLIVLAFLSRYFILMRRMVAPAIALVVMWALSSAQLGMVVGSKLEFVDQQGLALTACIMTTLLVVHYLFFRVPIAAAMIALGIFATAGALLVVGGAEAPALTDMFKLTNDGPFAWLTIVLGLVGLLVALWFDMSDPHRVTRRAATGFWLHVVAAPAIVNTIALTLLGLDTTGSQLLLLGFLGLMAVFAIVIDRRSFLISGVGYVVALAILVLDGQAGLAVLLLGLGLVLLGAFWERLRGTLMRGLPGFPGKDRLPPWDKAPATEA